MHLTMYTRTMYNAIMFRVATWTITYQPEPFCDI